jgi:2,3-bisphosphoglycerate-dependent phosphoglycerate mutase
MKTYIYFVRHAISPFSLDNERDRGLSEQGKIDSIRVAELLSNEGIDVVASSTFVRAVETVRPLADYLNKEILQFEDLVERPIASLKYEISEEELVKGIEKSFTDIDYCLAEGETTRQAQSRSVPTFKHILSEYKGKKVAIGTHGNIMTILLKYFDDSYGYDFWKQTSKPDIYKLEFEDFKLLGVERVWKPLL